jgi:hypothetical protein
MFTVIPESNRYINIQKASADIIIDGNRDKDIVYSDVCNYLNFVINQSADTELNPKKQNSKLSGIIGLARHLLD